MVENSGGLSFWRDARRALKLPDYFGKVQFSLEGPGGQLSEDIVRRAPANPFQRARVATGKYLKKVWAAPGKPIWYSYSKKYKQIISPTHPRNSGLGWF